MSLSLGPQKSESAWKMAHVTPIYVEFGATRVSYVTEQGQEPMFRHKSSSEIWIQPTYLELKSSIGGLYARDWRFTLN